MFWRFLNFRTFWLQYIFVQDDQDFAKMYSELMYKNIVGPPMQAHPPPPIGKLAPFYETLNPVCIPPTVHS